MTDKIDHSLLERVKENKINENSEQFFGEKGSFYHHEFAKYIRNRYNVINLDNLLHVYDDGIYIEDSQAIERQMINEIPQLKKAQRTETMNYLKLIAPDMTEEQPHMVAVKNGIYDIMNEELLPFDPKHITTTKINAAYDPDAYSGIVNDTLTKISDYDDEIKKLFEEIFGYLIYKRNFLDKSFLLVGKGGNGKSTLMKMYMTFVGDENISAISLGGLVERFNVAELHHKLLNAGDDIPLATIKDASVFKKLSTGEVTSAERKGQDPFYFKNYAKLIFSANDVPRWFENSNGVMDRLMIVPLNANLRHAADKDPFIDQKLETEEARSYMLNLAVKNIKELLVSGTFTVPKVAAQKLDNFKEENNPVLQFLHENEVHGEPTKETYDDYRLWCQDEGLNYPLSRRRFTFAVNEEGYYTRKARHMLNGQSVNVMTFYKLGH